MAATVLVVDDEPDILLLHRLNLEAAGYQVVLAADGMTALEQVADASPDCIVLDVMMPVLDGWGVLARLRESASSPPVLVVSAKSTPQDIARALELGAVAFLAKPFDSDVLVARVGELLAS